MIDKAFFTLVRKLHAAELELLRQVVAEQQLQLEAQAQRIEQLEREAACADGRAEMFGDLARELQDAMPNWLIGLAQDGHVGVLK